ncbi:MAG: hypothetical protein LBE08_00925, partial [Bifidobacteriaceae bacterium]|nr:hypothetical protein [Bifidobacteriaceae bacterium]
MSGSTSAHYFGWPLTLVRRTAPLRPLCSSEVISRDVQGSRDPWTMPSPHLAARPPSSAGADSPALGSGAGLPPRRARVVTSAGKAQIRSLPAVLTTPLPATPGSQGRGLRKRDSARMPAPWRVVTTAGKAQNRSLPAVLTTPLPATPGGQERDLRKRNSARTVAPWRVVTTAGKAQNRPLP